MIYWNNISSDDVRAIVEHYPDQPRPARKIDRVSVPGRNGDLLFPQDAFENYTQEYDIYISAEQPRLPRIARDVAAWLLAPKGYARLEDSYDLDTFRLAAYTGDLDIENVFNRFGRATIAFDCMPQRWYKTGQTAMPVSAPLTLHNPSPFAARPLIKVYGSAAGNLYVGNITVAINTISSYLTLDCEEQNAYKDGVNVNTQIYATEFPTLDGDTAISWDGGITNLEITPRWWTI